MALVQNQGGWLAGLLSPVWEMWMSRDIRILSEDQLARALHRATCGCAEGGFDLDACVLGGGVAWYEDARRLARAILEEERAEAATRTAHSPLATPRPAPEHAGGH